MAASDLAADEDMKSLLALFEGVDVKDQAKIAVLNALSETIRAQVVNWLQERAGSQQPVIDGDAVGSGKSDAQKPEPGMASAQNAIVTDEDTARDVQSSQGTSTTDTSAQNATVSDEATAHDIQSSQGTPAADVVLLAVQENNLQELQRLLKEGNVGLNVADAAGETPLFEAAASGNLDLFEAAASGNLDIAATLLLHTADPAHRSLHGMAASDLAADENMKSLLALFEGVDVKDQAKIAVLNALSETTRTQVVSWLPEKTGSQQPVIDGGAAGSGKPDAQISEPGVASAQNATVSELKLSIGCKKGLVVNSLSSTEMLLEAGNQMRKNRNLAWPRHRMLL
eukprot:TRINITY_DN8632_c0_g1_i9.p1 TRINITY_DN8632_c0_g1~~TRINITY_DN8632_c0_g1_i9.p1  ORF type:complete len:370 (-),score=94.42 TRINITY_DN8632_c0_g1_i9:424-1446(-)